MNKTDYKYIENRLNEMCKHHITIVYDKSNSMSFYKDNEISKDSIIFKVYGFGSHKLSISRKFASYSCVINLLLKKYYEVINNGK